MTTIHLETALNDAAGAGREGSGSAISQAAIDRGVSRGRRLRSQAFGHAFSGLGRWVVSTARAAVGRRATTRLGCGECGDMMRA